MEFLKGSTIYLATLIFLMGCNADVLETLPTDAPSGNYCPTVARKVDGSCPTSSGGSAQTYTTTNWDFTTASDYTYPSNYVEITSGKANLKTVDQTHSGGDFSSGSHVGTYLRSSGRVSLLFNTIDQILPSQVSSLAGDWRFDGNFTDSSLNGLDFTLIGAPTITDPFRGSGASVFDGVSDSASVNVDLSSTQKITLSFWHKWDETHVAYSTVLEFTNNFNASDGGFAIFQNCSGCGGFGKMEFVLKGDTHYNRVYIDRPGDGEYHHYSVVFDKNQDGNNEVKVYLDGERELGVNDLTNDNTNFFGSDTLYLMARGGSSIFGKGSIDEFLLFSSALSSEDIKKIYDAQKINFTELSPSWTPHWSNIVGYWKMDGNWQDSSGNGNHGTAAGNATFTITSKVGSQSGTFDGTGDYVSSSGVDLSSMTEGSLGVWVKSSVNSTSNNRLIEIGNTTNRIGLILDSSQVLHLFILSSSSICLDLTTSEKINNGSWHYITGTYGADGAQIFIDGQQVAISSSDCSGAFMPVSSSIFVGQFVGGGNYEWDGSLDDAAIWRTKLSLEEINQIYNRQKQKYAGHYDSPVIDLGASGSWTNLDAVTSLPFGKEIVAGSSENSSDYSDISGDLSNGLVAYWPLNESSANSVSGNDFEDKTSNDIHGNEMGGVAFGVNGIIKNSVQLDGSNDYISLSSPSPLDGICSEVTVAAWVQFNITSHDMAIFDKSIGGFTNRQFQLFIPTVDNNDFMFRIMDGGSQQNATTSGDYLVPGQWIFVVGSYDGNNVKVYVDGIERANTVHIGDIDCGVGDARIGALFQSGYESDGSIDEVAIWSRALSATEIQQLYRRGANRIKYQVKSCVDSSCNCKSYNTSPVGSASDCDGDGVANSSDTSDSYAAEFIGPGGDGTTYYSELFNRANVDMTFNCSNNTSDSDSAVCVDDEITLSGDTNATSLSFTFGNMASSASPSNNQYFQYRVIMEAEDNTACSGQPCLPEVTSVEVGPTGRYYGGSPVVKPNTPITYSDITQITFTNTGSCTVTYQISPDGTTYYYHNGTSWTTASSEVVAQSTSGTNIESNITSFKAAAGSGSLYFKAFMTSDTSQSCGLDDISVKVPN